MKSVLQVELSFSSFCEVVICFKTLSMHQVFLFLNPLPSCLSSFKLEFALSSLPVSCEFITKLRGALYSEDRFEIQVTWILVWAMVL